MKEPEHIPAQHEVSTNRLETLTDGIFAIAMTLLVFGLSISDPDRTPLLTKLGHLLPME